MGRRSNLPRLQNDGYTTPPSAVVPLQAVLPLYTRFIEPCAGNGALVHALEANGHTCLLATDIVPRHPSIVKRDALSLTTADVAGADCFITNLPWSRPLLHPLIAYLRRLRPLWTIIDANWAHTKQAAELMQYCSRIVSIGRVRWFEGTPSGGKDYAAWYKFEAEPAATIFTGRAA